MMPNPAPAPEPVERCACGQPLHYTDATVEAFVRRIIAMTGPTMMIGASGRLWRVPRHYIALHGIRAWELPMLAHRYGFDEITGTP